MQNRFNFGKGVLSIFLTKIMAAIIDFNGSGRLGREINLYQGGGGRGGNNTAFHFPAHAPTIHSDSKSNMVSLINNHQLIVSAHPNKMPAPQASWYLMIVVPDDPIMGCDDFGDDDLGDAEAIQALTNVEANPDEKPTTKVKVVQTLQ